MWLFYQLLLALGLLLAAPFLLLARGRHYLPTIHGRLGGHRGPASAGALWLHAVSVGEVGVAATLAGALPERIPLLVTTVTPTGQGRARALFAGRGVVTYLPVDLGFAVRRFLARFEPRALVLVEGDLWPLLLARVRRRGLPIVVVNGKVSDRSYRRLRLVRPFARRLLGRVDRFAVQTGADRDKLLALGVPANRVEVSGNLKFESTVPKADPGLVAWLRQAAGARPILVAGSTMPGEEALVVEAFQRLGGGARALLLLAPRHPERWDETESLLRGAGLRVCRRSAEPRHEPADVVLLDSLGELAALYRVGAAAFIGGTLVRTGGHNPLEAARFGVPIAVGPSMENFREMADQFDAADAWRRVADPSALAATWRRWLDDPERAAALGARGAALVEANRGALTRTLETLRTALALDPPDEH